MKPQEQTCNDCPSRILFPELKQLKQFFIDVYGIHVTDERLILTAIKILNQQKPKNEKTNSE